MKNEIEQMNDCDDVSYAYRNYFDWSYDELVD